MANGNGGNGNGRNGVNGNGNGFRPDWSRWVAFGLALLGWAFTLGVIRQEINGNTAHQKIPFHEGVRQLTEANEGRIRALELGQREIKVKLDLILKEIEKLDR